MKSLKELMSLEGRVALITGGAGHIGVAMGEALAELRSAVVILDLDRESCSSAAGLIEEAYGVDTMGLALDLADEKEVKKVPEIVLDRFGRLDVLINCAALVGTSKLKGWAVPFRQQDIAAWRQALEINLTSVFTLVQSCADVLKSSGHGTVVNIASIYGMVGPDMSIYKNIPMGNPAAYAAGKGGLLQLTRWLATVLAPDIRVNAITPGGIWREQPEIFCERYKSRTPLQRMATEEDLKGAVAYLASDLSSYVTGHNLVVDGGWTAW